MQVSPGSVHAFVVGSQVPPLHSASVVQRTQTASSTIWDGRQNGVSPAHWVQPKLVAEVTFLQWTRDNQLRAPVFVALRTDKLAKACTRAQLVQTDRGVVS